MNSKLDRFTPPLFITSLCKKELKGDDHRIMRLSRSKYNLIADIPDNSMETILKLDRPSKNQAIISSNQNSSTTAHPNTFQNNIFVGSWNVGGVSPPDSLDLQDWLTPNINSAAAANIYVLGFQEIVPLNAGNVVRSENRKICRKWNSLIEAALNKNNKIREDHIHQLHHQGRDHSTTCVEGDDNNTGDFRCIVSKQMVGIFLSVWVPSHLCQYITHLSISCVGSGIMGRLGNKGSVSVRFWLHETSFCFVCSHLASGAKHGDERRRNADAAEILSRTTFPPPTPGVGPPSHHLLPTKILDHDRVIWLGDLNYRIYLLDATIQYLVEKRKWNLLLEYDQLKMELMEGHVFEGWHEGAINFAPSYKYYPNSGVYFGCDQKRKHRKKRAPAWCDRIIWFGKGLKQNQYGRGESRLSDHRPVRAIFTAEIEVLRDLKGFQCLLSDRLICFPNHLKNVSMTNILVSGDQASINEYNLKLPCMF